MFHHKKKAAAAPPPEAASMGASPPPRSPPRTPAHPGKAAPRHDAAVLPPPAAASMPTPTPFATSAREEGQGAATVAPPPPALSARTLERRVSLSSRPVDVLSAALAAQRNELISVFACLEHKARAGGTPLLRPHVLVDECARLESRGGGSATAAAAPVYDPDAPIGEEYDDDASRASLAAVFRSCIEVLVVLPPDSNGNGIGSGRGNKSPCAALPSSPADAIDASSGAVAAAPGSCAPCNIGRGSPATRVALALRLRPGVFSYIYFRGGASSGTVEELSASQYLALKERVASEAERADERRRAAEAEAKAAAAAPTARPRTPPARHPSSLPPLEEDNPFAVLEIDLAPFNREFPKLTMSGSIGDGVRFLNRYLSAQLFQRPADGDDPLFGAGGAGGGFGGGGPISSSPQSFARRSLSGFPGSSILGGAPISTTTPSGAAAGVMQGALTQGKVQLFNFLRALRAPSGESLLVSPALIDTPGGLANALLRSERRLDDLADDAPWSLASPRVAPLGLERGWGATVGDAREMMRLLLDVLEAPSADALERFLSRLPLVTDVAILSPHGFFGQLDNLLGLPDTGGQVVYLIDVTRGLEREMRRRLDAQGLPDIVPRVVIVTRLIPDAPPDTTCAQRLERVIGTEHAVILRVPFRTADGRVLRPWVSRFDVAPYLERFALDVERELLAMLGRPPSLIVGNYTDGGMVATLLEQRFGGASLQCHIAHALELSKYQDADVLWRRYAPAYHFDVQTLSDLIAINNSAFVIASSALEIRGSEREAIPGQYEQMSTLVLPGLCRIVNGCDIFDPKFNVVPPGVDDQIYFPFTDTSRRLTSLQPELEELVYGSETGPRLARGSLSTIPERRNLPLLFTMARLDRVKNISSLVEWYATSPRLRACCNLVVVAGVVDPTATTDREERDECARMHALFDAHGLDGCVRWLVAQKSRARNGELYRLVADSRGAFVQPAIFEAFGLSVIESMATGLPTFATKNGGPSEIIRHGVSGFHIDPFHGASAAAIMADFFEAAVRDAGASWRRISEGALKRVAERYTWRRYADRLLTLTGVYSFWRVVSDLERVETRRYLQSLYCLLLRPRVEAARKAAAERDAALVAAAAAGSDA